jgi:hypothetical protein
MRALRMFFAMIFVFAFSSVSFADDGPMGISFTRVAQDGGYTVTASRVVAIFTSNPGSTGAQQLPDTYVKGKSVWILKALPEGSRLYAIGLGSDWAGQGPDIKGIDLTKAKAEAPIVGGMAKLDFVRPDGQECRVINLVIVLPDGTRAWGPTTGDGNPYHVHVGGKPALGWCFKDNSVVAMGQDHRRVLAATK